MSETYRGRSLPGWDVHEVLQKWAEVHGWDGYIYSYRQGLCKHPRSWDVQQASPSAGHLIATYYAEHFNELDPIAPLVDRSACPIRWSLQDFASFRRTKIMSDVLDSNGFAAGLSIPFHGPNSSVTSLVLLSSSPFIPEDRLDLTVRDVYPLWISLGHRIPQLCDDPPVNIQLSGREIECLSWVAAGKTSWEISRIVGISQRTVEFHIRNCARKLGCTSRSQTVSRATSFGLLSTDQAPRRSPPS